MFWLGAGVDHAPIHSDTFDFTDDSIAYGIQVLQALMFRGQAGIGTDRAGPAALQIRQVGRVG